jgi:hypothetical protein
MQIESDFKEFIRLLNKNYVKYIIVGGYAYSYYAEPRFTKDIDIFIQISPDNAEKMLDVLNEFGFADTGASAADFMVEGRVIQLGQSPLRIDILTSIDGLSFMDAWNNRVQGRYGDIPAFFISKDDLLKNKLATGRSQDLVDIEKLNKI